MYKKEDFIVDHSGIADCGWFIAPPAGPGYRPSYLHKDLQLHDQSGYEPELHQGKGMGMAPGYYPGRKIAEEYLNAFLEKQKMDSIEITAKVNGKVVPLDTISTETFDKMKKACLIFPVEPKYEGVYTAKGDDTVEGIRVIFEVTRNIADNIGRVVALDRHGSVCNTDDTLDKTLTYKFCNGEPLYYNIKLLGD